MLLFSLNIVLRTWDIDGERVRFMSCGQNGLIGLSSDRSTYFAGTQNNNAMFLYQYEVRAGDFYSRENSYYNHLLMKRRRELANVVRCYVPR